jgi:hypothetical protein
MAQNDYGLPEEATMQAVYDKVVTHLIRQGRPSLELPDDGRFDEEAGCLYRSPDGLACAIGCLISDDDYVDDIEHQSAESLLSPKVFSPKAVRDLTLFPESIRTGPTAEMIKDLQVIHDNAALDAEGKFILPKLRSHLRRLADRFDLRNDVFFNFPGY